MNKEEKEQKLIFIIQCASVDSTMSEFWCYNENVFGHLLVMMVSAGNATRDISLTTVSSLTCSHLFPFPIYAIIHKRSEWIIRSLFSDTFEHFSQG